MSALTTMPSSRRTPGAVVEFKLGDVLTCDVLEWDAGYDFGRPCLMLSPIIRENSDSDAEHLIENAMIDICCAKGRVEHNIEQNQIEWRGWNMSRLRRIFNETLAGKKRPRAKYTATRQVFKLVLDDDKQWFFEQVGDTVTATS